MKKSLFVQITLPLVLLIGCGKGDDKTANVQGVAAAPQFAAQSAICPTCTTSPTIPIQGSNGFFFAQYEFQESGSCNTGVHRFSGQWSEQVREQLCRGLANNYYNGSYYGYGQSGGCSPNLRAQAIAATCAGINTSQQGGYYYGGGNRYGW